MEEFDFTEDEIKEQLEILGYYQVPKGRLIDFKRDLEQLVKHEKSKNSSIFSTSEQSSSSDSEVQRLRHVNGFSRPITDENHRQTTSNGISHVNVEHSTYGKENIFIAQPAHSGEPSKYAKSDNPSDVQQLPHSITDGRRTAHSSVDAWRTAHPQYTLYDDADEAELVRRDEGPQEADTTLDTTTSTERRIMKRKVLRKRDGHTEVFETESESGDLDSLQDRLRNLPISVHIQRPSTAPGHRRSSGASTYVCRRPESAREAEPNYRLPDDYEGLKALIRPMPCEPHKKNIKKTDPVARYQQYRNSWDNHRAPGEKSHKGLRWGIREQMLYHDQVVEKKQPKVFLANNFKVPTDKKRKNLRWNIRNDLAQGVVPPSMFD